MKKLNVTVDCIAVFDGSILVPDELTLDEAINYAKDHIDEIPNGPLCRIYDTGDDMINASDCYFDEKMI